MCIRTAVVVTMVAFLASQTLVPANAFTEIELTQPFDGSKLDYDEARFLQVSLALSGDYNGLIDGAWGPGSDRALARFAAREAPGVGGLNWVASSAAQTGLSAFYQEGWSNYYLSHYFVTVLVPMGALEFDDSEAALAFHHTRSTLRYTVDRVSDESFGFWHQFALRDAMPGMEPYTLRRDKVNITSVTMRSGVTVYVRSDLVRGGWTTVVLSARPSDAGALAAASGSIRPGNTGEIQLPRDSILMQGLESIARIAERENAPQTAPSAATVAQPPPPSRPPEEGGLVSGTGFLVAADGKLLTNNHVIEHCSDFVVGENKATLLATDPAFDLALLDVPGLASEKFASFTAAPARLNSDLTVVGYPLHGLLSGLNVTRGSLTSLKGLGGSSTEMQISAPVQPGNSGGPVLNSSGGVIGVVVSKLDAGLVQEAIGDVPQNVNFAIRGEVAKVFLSSNGVQPTIILDSAAPISPEDLAQRAAAFTYLIECR